MRGDRRAREKTPARAFPFGWRDHLPAPAGLLERPPCCALRSSPEGRFLGLAERKQRGGAVDLPPSAVAARTDRRIASGSRSTRHPAPKQAARQVRRDRRAAADGVRLPSPFQEIPARRAVPRPGRETPPAARTGRGSDPGVSAVAARRSVLALGPPRQAGYSPARRSRRSSPKASAEVPKDCPLSFSAPIHPGVDDVFAE